MLLLPASPDNMKQDYKQVDKAQVQGQRSDYRAFTDSSGIQPGRLGKCHFLEFLSIISDQGYKNDDTHIINDSTYSKIANKKIYNRCDNDPD